MVNMIQAYIQNSANRPQPQPKKQDVEIVNVKKAKPNFDIHRELANRTFIKPLPGQGHLVKSKITDMPAVIVKDFAYDLKALKDGWTGKANDHQLGKLNDMGLAIGGLSLAGFLATRKQTPMTKAMEFIGLGSFLASMAIWPKIAIQWPAQLIHGVNIFQQYEDSFGRKKPLYQDPQFIPWDLYSDDEINKIGDRLGVPRDIENRRDFIQEKMRKIAVQNNTLWMLTAGFATPVMCALICSQAEPYVGKFLNNMQMKKADNLLNHFADSTKAQTSNKIIKNVDSFIELHKEHPIDDDMIRNLAKNLTEGMDALTAEAIEQDLKNVLKPAGKDSFNIVSTTANTMIESIQKALETSGLDKSITSPAIPSKEQLTKLFESEAYAGKDLTMLDLTDMKADINSIVRKNIKDFNAKNPAIIIDNDDKQIILNKLFSGKTKETPISKVLVSTPAAKLDSRAQTIIKTVANIMTEYKAKVDVLDKYAYIKFASAPETGLANYWNDVADSITKIFKFTPEEIKNTRADRELMTELVREKMEKIASNDDEYKRVLKAICEKVNTMKDIVKADNIPQNYVEAVDKSFNMAAKALENIKVDDTNSVSFDMTSQHLIGPKAIRKIKGQDTLYRTENCSLKALQKAGVSNRFLGIRSTFEALVNSLMFYRKVATNNLSCLKNRPREIKEEVMEFGKQLGVDRHMADFETKLYALRNPYPDMNDLSDVVVKDGKVENKYFGKSVVKNVDLPMDWDFYKLIMEALYKDPIDADSEAIFRDTNFMGLSKYRESVYKEIGDTSYFAKPFHCLENNGSTSTSMRKFLMLGMSPDELFSKIGMRKFNSQKWLKVFGTIGGAILGVTVLSQFFFGRLKPPEKGQRG